MPFATRSTRALLLGALWALSGCAHYTGTGRALAPDAWNHEPGWTSVAKVPALRQHAEQGCGPTALAMLLGYWTHAGLDAHALGLDEHRTYSAGELRDRARALGFAAFVIEGSLEDIQHELVAQRPVIVGMAKPTLQGPVAHFEVVVGINPDTKRIATLDPALGFRQNSLEGFAREWVPAGQLLLIVLGPRTESEGTKANASAVPLAHSSR